MRPPARWCVITSMAIELVTPEVDELGDVVDVLRTWQHDTAPMQLHPGDLGWYWRTGAERTAADVRTWRRGGRVLAVGLLDGPTLLRLTLAPDAHQDPALARQLLADVGEPKRGVLPEGPVDIEAPRGVLLHDLLAGAGWRPGEAWTPLRRDLTEPVRPPAVRIEVAGRTGRTRTPPCTGRRLTARRSAGLGGTRWRPGLRTRRRGVCSRTTTRARRWRR